jgi:hypothetical protein
MNRRRGPAGENASVSVVLGEAATSTSLREILDGAGFDVVGQASAPGDLLRLLAGVEPDVIVLDAEVSATAALSVRDLAPLAGIVVVWPAAVSSSVADRQVTPARAAFDLPDAVRRAKRPKEARVAVLAAVPAMAAAAPVVPLFPRPRARRRVREHAFGLVAASFIIAVASLGVVRTAMFDQDRVTLGESIQGPGGPSVALPPIGNGETAQPQPPIAQPKHVKRIGDAVLLPLIVPASSFGTLNDSPPLQQNDDDNGNNGHGNDDGPDGVDNSGHHGGEYNGYDNPRVHVVASHRVDTPPERGNTPDLNRNSGLSHAVHGERPAR